MHLVQIERFMSHSFNHTQRGIECFFDGTHDRISATTVHMEILVLRGKCPNSFFWSVFSCIRTE